jgi:hypothetical protein
MPFDNTQRQLIREIVGWYCEQKVLDDLKDQVRVFYSIKGYTVTIVQSKPSFPGSHLWTDCQIARLKYDPRTFNWELYRRNLTGEWQRYPDFKPTRHLQSLIDEIADDRFCVFWA